MIHALGNGADAVIPCLTVESAREAAREIPAAQRLSGGERHGTLIPGFDLGNSPLEYTPERVRGKTILFTTTNGTRALMECRTADAVVVGAFVNRHAVVSMLRQRHQDVHLVCAGTDGQLTAEDILFAGAVASDLLETTDGTWNPGNIQTQMGVDYYRARSQTPERFREAFFGSLGAKNLIHLGMTADIERCQQENLFPCVPYWNHQTGCVTISH